MYGKKKIYKKRPYRKVYKKSSFKALVNNAISKRLDKKVENKFVDTFFSHSGFNTAIQCLTITTQNLGDSSVRIGDQIKCRSLQLRGQLTNSDTFNTFRITLIRANLFTAPATPIAVGDIYQDVASSIRTINSPFHMDNMRAGLFTILYDKRARSDNDDPIQMMSFFKKLSHRIDYSGGTSTAKGHMFLYLTNDSLATPNPSMDFYTRIIYNDI